MSVNNNRARFSRARGRRREKQPGDLARPLPPVHVPDGADVRPDKVAKAKELIARDAYPSTQVVRSLAEQIARFF